MLFFVDGKYAEVPGSRRCSGSSSLLVTVQLLFEPQGKFVWQSNKVLIVEPYR